jgi:predicted amidophosphoribosyltransferase
MSKLTIALGSLFGGSGKSYCPDCGSDLKSNGCCSECGYGEDEGEMEDEGEEEGMDMQALIDLKNDLQRVMEKIDRLIVNGD